MRMGCQVSRSEGMVVQRAPNVPWQMGGPSNAPFPPPVLNTQYYQAVFDFTARSDIEISLTSGDIVKVLDRKDLDDNPDWWYVEHDEMRGFAPAKYLYLMRQ